MPTSALVAAVPRGSTTPPEARTEQTTKHCSYLTQTGTDTQMGVVFMDCSVTPSTHRHTYNSLVPILQDISQSCSLRKQSAASIFTQCRPKFKFLTILRAFLFL